MCTRFSAADDRDEKTSDDAVGWTEARDHSSTEWGTRSRR